MFSIEQVEQLVELKINELYEAVTQLEKNGTKPYTPFPRLRFFKITPKIMWPSHEGELTYVDIYNNENAIQKHLLYDRKRIVSLICTDCGYQPRKLLRAIRRIEAAIEWCKRRTEGRKRAAEEILKQQKKATDALTALIVAYKLTKQKP